MKIFLGPTRPSNIPADADLRPPAQQGDIAAAALEGPDTLMLIDGLFHQSLSPWHKEILFAIERGCRVIGAGSLGALRAVECARYGAEPVGIIAGWYADDSCTDDADVALAHGHAEDGYRALSIPIVNLRATAECLVADGLLPAAELPGLLAAARSIYYVERSWPRLRRDLGSVADLLQANYRDQKALDAEEAIRHAQHVAARSTREEPKHTLNAHMLALLENDLPSAFGREYSRWTHSQREIATDAALIAELAQAVGITVTPHDIQIASSALWDGLGIHEPAKAEQWLCEHGISEGVWMSEALNEAIRRAARAWLTSTSNAYDTVPRAKIYHTIHKQPITT
jgi:hypothetical protein